VDTPVKTVSDDHPEKAVDVEIVKIASEKWSTPDGPEATGGAPGVTSGDGDREERADV
jgi:hypothetical protein